MAIATVCKTQLEHKVHTSREASFNFYFATGKTRMVTIKIWFPLKKKYEICRPKGKYRQKNGGAQKLLKIVSTITHDRCRNVFLQCIITTYVARYQRYIKDMAYMYAPYDANIRITTPLMNITNNI